MGKTDIITLLHTGGYSCVVQHEDKIRTYNRHGIIDLYELYETDPSFLYGSFVADKIIGKGAAALLALGGVAHVYADVISTSALTLLRKESITIDFSLEVLYIINRQKNGRCPLETACNGIESLKAIYPVIQDFVRKHFSSSQI